MTSEERKSSCHVNRNGKLVVNTGTVIEDAGGRRYLVMPSGEWRRMQDVPRKEN